MSVLATPDRFSYASEQCKRIGPSYVDCLKFDVDQDDVEICGAVVFIPKAVRCTARLALYNESGEKLQSVTHSHLGEKKCDRFRLEFDHGVAIEKETEYTLQVRLHAHSTFMTVGYKGYRDLLCTDGTIFKFFNGCDCATLKNERKPATRGQFPYLLYSTKRSRTSQKSEATDPKQGALSLTYASIELSLSLTDGNFSSSSDEVKLHRFMFSLLVRKAGSNLSVLLQCRPSVTCDDWSITTEAKTILVYSESEGASKCLTTTSTFNHVVKSSEIVTIPTDSLQLSDQHKKVILSTVIRYETTQPVINVSRVEPLDFTKPWKGSDIVITFDDKRELYCHKTILKLASPVFERMLDAELKEKQENRIVLMGKCCDSFEKLLHFIYPGANAVTLDEGTAFELIEMFHEYDIAVLEQKAEAVLTKKANRKTALKYLCVAALCGFEDLKEKSLKIAAAFSSQEIKGDTAYYQLDDEFRSLLQDARLKHANLD